MVELHLPGQFVDGADQQGYATGRGWKTHEDAAQEVEVVVAVIYELGEGASEAAFKPGSGALANLSMGGCQTLA